MDGRRVVQRLVNGESALVIARSSGTGARNPFSTRRAPSSSPSSGISATRLWPGSGAWALYGSPGRSAKRRWRRIEPGCPAQLWPSIVSPFAPITLTA